MHVQTCPACSCLFCSVCSCFPSSVLSIIHPFISRPVCGPYAHGHALRSRLNDHLYSSCDASYREGKPILRAYTDVRESKSTPVTQGANIAARQAAESFLSQSRGPVSVQVSAVDLFEVYMRRHACWPLHCCLPALQLVRLCNVPDAGRHSTSMAVALDSMHICVRPSCWPWWE